MTLRWTVQLFKAALVIVISGCTIHYFDAANGIEHAWGLAHIAMRVEVPTKGLQAVGWRTDTVGLLMGTKQDGLDFAFGLNSYQEIQIAGENTQLCLAWPKGSFYNVRIGDEFPPQMRSCGRDPKEKKAR
jgi:hypothetical protein